MNWRSEEDILHPVWLVWDWYCRMWEVIRPAGRYILLVALLALLAFEIALIVELWERLEWLDANYRP